MEELLLVIIFLVLVLIGIHWKFLQSFFRLPGPRLNIYELIKLYETPFEGILVRLSALLHKYDGELAIFFGPAFVFFTSKPEHIEMILKSHNYDHSSHYDLIKCVFGDSIFTVNGASWKNSRKLYLKSFRTPAYSEFFIKMMKHASVLVEIIEKETTQGEFDVAQYIQNYAMDVIFDTALNYDMVQFQKEHRKVLNTIEKMKKIVYSRLYKVWEHYDWIFHNISSGKQLKKEYSIVCSFLEDIFNKIRSNPDLNDNCEAPAFINNLFKTDTTKESLCAEISLLILAGGDTTAFSIDFLLLMLGSNQDVQQKVFEEDLDIQVHLNRTIEIRDLDKYTYLDRVVKENLRLFPIAPIMIRKVTTDLKLGKYTLPIGSTVAIPIFSLHRDPSIYDNSLNFNPDNFLPVNIQKRHPYAYVPFSGGGRSCVGKKFTIMLLKVTVICLLRQYKIFSKVKGEDVTIRFKGAIQSANGYKICLEKREKVM